MREEVVFGLWRENANAVQAWDVVEGNSEVAGLGSGS